MLSWHDTLAIAFRNRTLFAPPGEDPTESVSVASAADKNFTLLSCCCLLLLFADFASARTKHTQSRNLHTKKISPRSRINPKCQSETAATICGRDVKRQNHAISRTPPPAEIHANLFPASTKKTTRERTIQGGAATASLDRVLGHFRARSGATHGRTRRPGVSRERFHRNGNSLGHFAANGNGIRRGPDGAPQSART